MRVLSCQTVFRLGAGRTVAGMAGTPVVCDHPAQPSAQLSSGRLPKVASLELRGEFAILCLPSTELGDLIAK